MLIGIDFDNTMICYDRLLHHVAQERGLIPAGVGATKTAVRDYLRAQGRERDWTRLQGEVYGARIHEAAPYPGVLDFLIRCRRQAIEVCVVSHKTRYPVLGTRVDLHAAARDWLERQAFLQGRRTGLSAARVHFEVTKAGKLERIGALGCSHFIDDLPEFLAEPAFPSGVQRILFDPAGTAVTDGTVLRAASWDAITHQLLNVASVR